MKHVWIQLEGEEEPFIESIQGGHRFHVISSSPASGKTSLLHMIIGQTSKIKFIDVTFLYKAKAEDTLKYHTGIDLVNKKCSLPFPVQSIICIDDAHRKHEQTDFWTTLIKTGPEFIPDHASFIFSVGFPISASAEFNSLPKITRDDLLLTNDEAMEFLMLPGQMPKEWLGMSKLIDAIMKECKALKKSVAFLENRTTEYNPMEQNEDQLIGRFMSDSILDFMSRCFGSIPSMPSRECE